jgi:hypothetical protein
MKRVLRQSWSDTPSTSRVLFETTPRVSGRSKWARIEALGRRLDFEAEYVVARDKVVCLLEAAGRARDRSLLACATSPASVTSSSRTAPT